MKVPHCYVNAGAQWHRERADFEIEAMRGK
jgi:hypothetical protein